MVMDSHPTIKPEARSASFQFEGVFYEACNCYSICPCWTGNNPDDGTCTGMFVWDIETGTIDGVVVGGLRAVSVSQHSGARDEARQRVVIFVDESATRRQSDALVAALSGSLGGPLQELADAGRRIWPLVVPLPYLLSPHAWHGR
jgi:hypothetical protein